MQLHPATLAFEKKQEKAYNKVYFNDSLPIVRTALVLTGMLYGIFGYLDYLVVGEHSQLFLFIRFAVVLPFLALVLIASYTSFFSRIWQPLVFIAYILSGTGISIMISQLPDNGSYYGGLMLIFTAGFFFIRLRFIWASASGWITLLIFNLLMIFATGVNTELLITYNFFYISAIIIGMYGTWHIETSSRKNFLLNLQLNEKNKEVEDVNINLEAMIENRTRDLIASEERFRNLADLLPLMVFEVDTHGNIKYINQEVHRQMGACSKEELGQVTLFSFVVPEDLDKAKAEFKASLEIPDLTRGEYMARRFNGQAFPVMVYSKPIFKNNKCLGMRSVAVDITEQKTNEKLRTEVAVTRQSAEFKQSFLANMSHEIRTPLTGIIGITEILSKTQLNANQKDYLNTLKQSTENLREIINQILDYSKIEAGKVMLKPEAFHTKILFKNAVKFYNSIIQKPVVLSTDIDESLPPFIKADIQRIQQIVSNLVSNAVKFTNQGKISLRAKTEKWIDETRLMVRIEIEDTGIGIAEEKQQVLFQPFSQIDHRDTRNFEGTGLGLSICRDLTTLLNGHIGVKSTKGEGSTFWFTFEAEIAGISDVSCQKPDNKEMKDIPSLRILLVEDKVVNQKVIGLILSSQGHIVTHAANGKQALEIFQPGYFDLVLMDIQMPEMDGITATRQLREKHNELPPIVGLSANAFEGDKEKYMAKGMDDYLTKPVRGEDFSVLTQKWFA